MWKEAFLKSSHIILYVYMYNITKGIHYNISTYVNMHMHTLGMVIKIRMKIKMLTRDQLNMIQ